MRFNPMSPDSFDELQRQAKATTSAWEGVDRQPANKRPVMQPKMDPMLERARAQKLMEVQQGLVNEQLDDIDALAEQPNQIDLSPLMALADAWGSGKSNLSGGYKAPQSPIEKTATMAKLRDMAAKDQQQVTKDQLQLLLGTESNETKLARQISGAMGKELTAYQQYIQQKDLGKDIEELRKGFSEESNKLGRIQANLAQGDYQSTMATLSLFSRFVSGEKGVLTEEDIGRALPSTVGATWAKAMAYFNNPNAEMSPEIIKGLKKLTKIAQQKTAQRYRELAQDTESTYASMPSMGHLFGPKGAGRDMFMPLKKRIQSFDVKEEEKEESATVVTQATLEESSKILNKSVKDIKADLLKKNPNVKFE